MHFLILLNEFQNEFIEGLFAKAVKRVNNFVNTKYV
jgi:hypothetical protein